MSTRPRVAVFAGSFDPLTNGHVDVITRSVALFDRVIVAVLANTSKVPLFSADERVAIIRAAVAAWPSVSVDTFHGLLADYVAAVGAQTVVRGVRSAPEFAEESQMALMNKHLNPACETVFLASAPEHAHIASRLVREIATLGGDVSTLVPPAVADAFARRMRS